MSESKISKKEIKDELWRRGNLSWKCHSVQTDMYKKFTEAEARSISVWLLARQSGKSFLLGILALEQALKKPRSIIKLVTDTKIHVESIFEPTFQILLEDAPDDVKPEYDKKNYKYIFPNGSQIQLAGTDNKHYERLRGQKSDLILVDEAGFCNDLDDVIRSVLLPTTTHTGGKLILASTPPVDSEHEFYAFIEEAEMNGRLTKKTIYDNPLLKEHEVANIVKNMGGSNSEKFRREYLCELIRDSSTTVIPEFDSNAENDIVMEWKTPAHYDKYVAMDLGGKDLTVVLFGYYDFRNQKVVVQDEIVMDFRKPGNNIKTLTNAIIEKEKELWTDIYTGELIPPTLRVSDINYIVTQEISIQSDYQVNFVPAKKDDKAAIINRLRDLIQSRNLVIDPKCTTLIRHLKNVRWKSAANKQEFARSSDDGHYDAVDAALYLIRSIEYSKNPYPVNYNFAGQENLLFRPHPDSRTPSVTPKGTMGIATAKQNESENNKKIFRSIFQRKKG